MLKLVSPIGPFRRDAEVLCVGIHQVELLTTKGDGMLPVVVRDMVTDEILRFTASGCAAPGENREALVEGAEKAEPSFIRTILMHQRKLADVRRAMCSELVQYDAGSPEAVAVSKMMKAVNDVLRDVDDSDDESPHSTGHTVRS